MQRSECLLYWKTWYIYHSKMQMVLFNYTLHFIIATISYTLQIDHATRSDKKVNNRRTAQLRGKNIIKQSHASQPCYEDMGGCCCCCSAAWAFIASSKSCCWRRDCMSINMAMVRWLQWMCFSEQDDIQSFCAKHKISSTMKILLTKYLYALCLNSVKTKRVTYCSQV